MDSSVAVSIIIPFYNGSRFLNRCLECATHQFRELNYEIILINDGSTDGFEELASLWMHRGYPISLISTENKGVSNARNIGIDLAKGEYICFMDVDDLLRYYSLEGIYKYAKRCSLELVTYGMKKMSEEDALDFNTAPEYFDEQNILSAGEVINGYEYLRRTHGLIWEFACVWQYMFKRSKLKQSNVKFDSNLVYSEDLLFMWQILPQINQLGLIDADAYYYVQNPYSCLHTKNLKLKEKKADNMIYLAQKLHLSHRDIIADAECEINDMFSALIEDLIYRYFISIQTIGKSLAQTNQVMTDLQRLNLYPIGKYAEKSPYMPKGIKWKIYQGIINRRLIYLGALSVTNTIRSVSRYFV